MRKGCLEYVCRFAKPENPEVVIHSDRETPEESLQKILRTLELMGYVPPDPEAAEIPAAEEEEIREKLKRLGHL